MKNAHNLFLVYVYSMDPTRSQVANFSITSFNFTSILCIVFNSPKETIYVPSFQIQTERDNLLSLTPSVFNQSSTLHSDMIGSPTATDDPAERLCH
jgi:hypothetical protein